MIGISFMNATFKRRDNVALLTYVMTCALWKVIPASSFPSSTPSAIPRNSMGKKKTILWLQHQDVQLAFQGQEQLRVGLQLYQPYASSSSGVPVNRSFLHSWKCRITSGPFGKQSHNKEALCVILLSSPNRICLLSLPFSTPARAPWGCGDIC